MRRVIILLTILSLSFVADGYRRPPHQIIGDEICINYICRQVDVKLAIADNKVMYLSNGDRVIVVLIERVAMMKGYYFFHFAFNRGFLTVGEYSQNAFMYLDKDYVVIHIKHSTFKR